MEFFLTFWTQLFPVSFLIQSIILRLIFTLKITPLRNQNADIVLKQVRTQINI